MKAPALCFALSLLAGSMATAGEVAPGASLAEVRATLGVPNGQLRLGERQLLYYERGEIELQQGRVTRAALRSPEEQAILTAREERAREARETRRAQIIAEGTALRDRTLADPDFRAAPVAYQVSFWQDFAERYPGVSCGEPLKIARLRLNEQLEAKRQREEEANRAAEREERYAAESRTVYPLFTSYPRHRRYHDHSTGLGPISYTFFDKPLPPYTTPSGNPAGNLTGPVINSFTGNPALPDRDDQDGSYGDRDDRSGRSHGRGSGGHRFRQRM